MKLEITDRQLTAIINIIYSVESMMGCAETDEEGNNWDDDMTKEITFIDRMLKKNKIKRKP